MHRVGRLRGTESDPAADVGTVYRRRRAARFRRTDVYFRVAGRDERFSAERRTGFLFDRLPCDLFRRPDPLDGRGRQHLDRQYSGGDPRKYAAAVGAGRLQKSDRKRQVLPAVLRQRPAGVYRRGDEPDRAFRQRPARNAERRAHPADRSGRTGRRRRQGVPGESEILYLPARPVGLLAGDARNLPRRDAVYAGRRRAVRRAFAAETQRYLLLHLYSE